MSNGQASHPPMQFRAVSGYMQSVRRNHFYALRGNYPKLYPNSFSHLRIRFYTGQAAYGLLRAPARFANCPISENPRDDLGSLLTASPYPLRLLS